MGKGQLSNTPQKPKKKKQVRKAKNKRQNRSRTLRKRLAKLDKKEEALIQNPPEPDKVNLVMRATSKGLKLVPENEVEDRRHGLMGRRKRRTKLNGNALWRKLGK